MVEPGVVPVRLDVPDPGQVAAAAETCSDLTLLVNNAGVLTDSPLLGTPDRAFQEQLARRAASEDLSVRQVEDAIRARECEPDGQD